MALADRPGEVGAIGRAVEELGTVCLAETAAGTTAMELEIETYEAILVSDLEQETVLVSDAENDEDDDAMMVATLASASTMRAAIMRMTST